MLDALRRVVPEWEILTVTETDSTNSALKRLSEPKHGTALLAQTQTGGRGRLGRSFLSPKGGLYLSVLLRPQVPLSRLLHLTPMAAVAARRAVADCCGIAPDIKWTNDLVLNGKKVGGILTESFGGCVIVGIGINCNSDDFSDEVRAMATSLKSVLGREVDLVSLAAALILRLKEMDEALFTQKAAWLEEYKTGCITLGKKVQVIRGSERREAFAEDLNENGALLVRYENGETAVIDFGEVSVRGMYGYI